MGDHPAVFGSDFHYYLYKDKNEMTAHLNAALRVSDAEDLVLCFRLVLVVPSSLLTSTCMTGQAPTVPVEETKTWCLTLSILLTALETALGS